MNKEIEKNTETEISVEEDKRLGRCPFCHGEEVLEDPVVGDLVPCICTGIDPEMVLGEA